MFPQKFIIFIPLIIAITENLVNSLFISDPESRLLFSYNILITLLITVSIAFILIDSRRYKKKDNCLSDYFKILRVTAILILVLVLAITRSSDYGESIKSVWRYSVILLILPSTMFYFQRHPEYINKYFKSVFLSGFIYIIGIPFFSLFKIGNPLTYGTVAKIYGGGIGFYNIYPGVYTSIVMIVLIIYSTRIRDQIYIPRIKSLNYAYLIGIIIYFGFVFMIGKRDYMLMVLIGAIVFPLVYNRLNIRRYYPVFLLILTIGTLVKTSGFDKIFSNELRGVRRIQNKPLIFEGRYLEYVDYVYEFNNDRDWSYFFLGKEIFNSRGKFFQYSSILPDRDRVLHSDVTHFLYGTGVTGLAVYFYYFFRLLLIQLVSIRKAARNEIVNFAWALFITLFMINFAVNFSGGLFRLFDKLLQFQMMGACLALISNDIKGHKQTV